MAEEPPAWPWLLGQLGVHPGFVPTALPSATSPAGLPSPVRMVTVPLHPVKSRHVCMHAAPRGCARGSGQV